MKARILRKVAVICLVVVLSGAAWAKSGDSGCGKKKSCDKSQKQCDEKKKGECKKKEECKKGEEKGECNKSESKKCEKAKTAA